MSLDDLRNNIKAQLPLVKDKLETVCYKRSRLMRAPTYNGAQREYDIHDLMNKEQFLCGILGAMNRLSDQIFRYNELCEKSNLVRGKRGINQESKTK